MLRALHYIGQETLRIRAALSGNAPGCWWARAIVIALYRRKTSTKQVLGEEMSICVKCLRVTRTKEETRQPAYDCLRASALVYLGIIDHVVRAAQSVPSVVVRTAPNSVRAPIAFFARWRARLCARNSPPVQGGCVLPWKRRLIFRYPQGAVAFNCLPSDPSKLHPTSSATQHPSILECRHSRILTCLDAISRCSGDTSRHDFVSADV